MIAYVRLERFKCFLDETIPLAPLTILAGANNTGKSSVIQALLLLKQTVETSRYTEHRITTLNFKESTKVCVGLTPTFWTIPLNGTYVNMGSAGDLFCQWSEKDINSIFISFAVKDHPDKIFKIGLLCDLNHLTAQHVSTESNDDFYALHAILKQIRFTYIGAMRTGPQLLYPVSNESRWNMSVGNMGQFTVHCLHEFGQSPIATKELYYTTSGDNGKQSNPDTLLYQAEQWMNYLIPGIRFEYKKIPESDVLTMGISNYNKNTEYFRPTNVGFGITYCLPIVVAALMSKKGDVLICENPESHLHPEAQSHLAVFLVRVASAGIQVITETHSDHILNGIRVAVKRGIIKSSGVAINYFNKDYKLSRPVMDKDGRIDSWPEGFFDQINTDLGELL
ncbi:putative P-loop ATP-binding protein [Candidatus Magnetobacterium bavaricum]|uniref:Putative P-loop ATP-binding protein n=1 Tax=Candidatus Magnetobacterium bavaricum TaxID=29290 RepID=A0A0F3GQD8_9BACT|nr:putative P-loop ATP-binding protein [Candidatus Magnetobacterium bavaricum]